MEFYDLGVHQGESLELTLLFKNSDGSVRDLTGYEGYSQIRPSPDSDELTAEITVTITGEEGKAVLSLGDTVTKMIPAGCYAYDFCMRDPDGLVKYYIGGKFAVIESVTVIT